MTTGPMPVRLLALPPLLILVALAGTAGAQPTTPPLEVGVHAVLLRLDDFGATPAGVGGRISFDLSRWAALDVETNYYPHDEITVSSSSTLTPDLGVVYTRKRTDAFFGVKLGKRGERLGVFAKVRPGFARLTDRGVACSGADCARVLMLLAVPEYRTEFALDLGGVVEFYPTLRTVARAEIGDTMIRHRSFAPPCPGSACTSHNLSTRLGLGLRF